MLCSNIAVSIFIDSCDTGVYRMLPSIRSPSPATAAAARNVSSNPGADNGDKLLHLECDVCFVRCQRRWLGNWHRLLLRSDFLSCYIPDFHQFC